jgi:hypothetical protein
MSNFFLAGHMATGDQIMAELKSMTEWRKT